MIRNGFTYGSPILWINQNIGGASHAIVKRRVRQEIVVSRAEALHNERDIPGDREGRGREWRTGKKKLSLYQKKMRMMLLKSS